MAEDWECNLRAAALCEMRGVNQVLAENRIHDSQLSGDKRQLFSDSLRGCGTPADSRQLPGVPAGGGGGARKNPAAVVREFNAQARSAAVRGNIVAALMLGLHALWLRSGGDRPPDHGRRRGQAPPLNVIRKKSFLEKSPAGVFG